MRQTLRIIGALALSVCFNISLDTYRAAQYHPFSIDAYHLSALAAFMFAAAAGVVIAKITA